MQDKMTNIQKESDIRQQRKENKKSEKKQHQPLFYLPLKPNKIPLFRKHFLLKRS